MKHLIQVVKDHHHKADDFYLVGGKPPDAFAFVHGSSIDLSALLDKVKRLLYTE